MRISDWSSDVCSSDLRDGLAGRVGDELAADFPRRVGRPVVQARELRARFRVGVLDAQRAAAVAHDHRDQALALVETEHARGFRDRKSVVSGKSVSVRVDLGGRRILKKKRAHKTTETKPQQHNKIIYKKALTE